MRSMSFEKFLFCACLLFVGILLLSQNASAGSVSNALTSEVGFKIQALGLGFVFLAARLVKSSNHTF